MMNERQFSRLGYLREFGPVKMSEVDKDLIGKGYLRHYDKNSVALTKAGNEEFSFQVKRRREKAV